MRQRARPMGRVVQDILGRQALALFARLVRLALLFPTASDLQFTSSAERCFVVKNPCYLCYLWENKNNIPSINVCHCDTRTRSVHEVGHVAVPQTLPSEPVPLTPVKRKTVSLQYSKYMKYVQVLRIK